MSQGGSLKIIIPSVLKVSRNGEFKGVVIIIIILILRQRTKKITRKKHESGVNSNCNWCAW